MLNKKLIYIRKDYTDSLWFVRLGVRLKDSLLVFSLFYLLVQWHILQHFEI